MKDSLRRSLLALFGERQVMVDAVELLPYEIDAGLDGGAPDALVFPHSREDVVRLVSWAAEHRIPLVPRGAGTGLSGGAVAERGGVIVELARLNRVLDLDQHGRNALVEPGVVNSTLDELARTVGLYFPPDPASGRVSTIGGNVSENAGGPHCFKYGVTSNYVAGLEVVLADGRVVQLGGGAVDYPEYDLCGLVAGSEGTLGIITKCRLRLIAYPPAVRTLMAIFDSVEQAGKAVSAVIAAGLVPATMEMMDQKIVHIIEDYVGAGLPRDAGAVLIVEIDGYAASLNQQSEELSRIIQAQGGRDLRAASSAEERDRIWFARKSAAGAVARLASAFYTIDGTVPRSRLAEAIAAVNRICDEEDLRVGYVFHAGDGNLHPLVLIDDPADPIFMARVHHAGRRIAVLAAGMGGSITGEHGVGIEKRDYMPLMYSADELAAMRDVKEAFDPENRLNPGKVLPAEIARSAPAFPVARPSEPPYAPASAEAAAALLHALSATGRRIRIRGGGTKSRGLPETDALLDTRALQGIRAFAPDDLFVTVGAGTTLAAVQDFLAAHGLQVSLASPWPEATVGGIIAANANAPLRLRYGSIRDLVLAMTVVLGDGRLIRAGRPVVKNVAGYDLAKAFVGSYGSLGLIADVTLRLSPRPRARRTLLVGVGEVREGLAYAVPMLPLALVSSALLLCQGCHLPGAPESPYLLAYTAEGWPEDVEAELAQMRRILEMAGAPRPSAIDTTSGTDIWQRVLGSGPETDLVLRVGIPPRDLPRYLEDQARACLESAPFVADLASGLLHTTMRPPGVAEAGAWLETLRGAALKTGGYAVVMRSPFSAGLDCWGYRPSAIDVMGRLKARWDPGAVLGSAPHILDRS